MAVFNPIDGTANSEVLTGTSGDDHIRGFGGDDTLLGMVGNDWLEGGDGSDLLTGGAGIDMLSGGTGPDIFRDTGDGLNGDRITDFLPGDRIQISDLTTATANFAISGSSLTYSGGRSVQIDNLGPGRLVQRSVDTGGVELRLQDAAHNDFNGDGRSDVLLRNTGGTFNEWLGRTDGTFASNIANVNYGLTTDWHVSGTADFNGDGRNDILLRNDNGTINEWLGLPDGSYASNIANVNIPLSNSWRVVGTADFNGDGRSDVLLRNDNGTINEWLGLPDGSFASNLANVNYGLSTAWQVAGTGDFNGDGRNDVLLRNDNGTINEWLGLPDGSFASNLANVNIALDNAWHVVGTGDFNGDGRSDVLLRNDNGTVNEWLGLSDGSFASNLSRVNYASTTDWHIVGVGDFNGDAIDDLIWQNNDGSIRDWLGQSDGSFVTNTFNVNPGTQWQIQDPFVHDPFLPV